MISCKDKSKREETSEKMQERGGKNQETRAKNQEPRLKKIRNQEIRDRRQTDFLRPLPLSNQEINFRKNRSKTFNFVFRISK